MYRAFFPSFPFGIGTDILGLFFGRIGFLGFLFVAHSIPPQRTLCARASSDLCTIATTAIQTFQPDSLASGDSFLHYVSSYVFCCKIVATLFRISGFIRFTHTRTFPAKPGFRGTHILYTGADNGEIRFSPCPLPLSGKPPAGRFHEA